MSRRRKLYLNLTEAFRGAKEFKALRKEWPAIHPTMPEGDGHPVLVIPGFASNDGMTSPLRKVLKSKGYAAYGWGNGVNMGLNKKAITHLRDLLHDIYEKNGNRKVTLVGHSLGGLFARELAREYPDMVRGVITVASPFGAGVQKGEVPSILQKLIEVLSGSGFTLKDEELAQRSLTPPPVPTTSLFSKRDGTAGWKACLNPACDEAENIEINASHLGSIACVDTFKVILDRLAQPEGTWKPHDNVAKEVPPENPKWNAGKNFFKK